MGYADYSDEKLMGLVQNGELCAFDELRERHRSWVLAYTGRRIGDRCLAEDLDQEVWMRVWKGRVRWGAGLSFGPWLNTITRNVVIDHVRSETRKRKTAEPSIQDDCESGPGAMADEYDRLQPERVSVHPPDTDFCGCAVEPEHLQPERIAAYKEAREAVVDCVKQLDTRQERAFSLRVLEDLSFAEVAEELSRFDGGTITPKAAAGIVSRAMKKMRECLKRKGLSPCLRTRHAGGNEIPSGERLVHRNVGKK